VIETIGYADDGSVFIRLAMEISGQPHKGTLMLKPEFAREVAKSLVEAADMANEKTRVLQ
jgi:hypothetical protein